MTGGKTLLICPQGRGADKLRLLLPDTARVDADIAGSAAEARRMMAGAGYALAVVNAPLTDETGLELATELTGSTLAAVILLVKAELMSMVYAPATEAGVLVVSKPVIPQVFQQTLQLAAATRSRLLVLSRENERLHQKLEEIRVIDRAKCLLIENMRISETEAHRAIEKQAMDRRVSRVLIAKELLKRLEL